MVLTARDKKLLIVLGVFVFIVIFVKFLLIPKINNITTLNADIDTLNNSYAMNMSYKTKTGSIDSDIKILSEKLKDLRAIYPPSINGDELLIIMKDLINDSELDITSMVFDRAKPTNLHSEKDIAANSTNNGASNADSQTDPQNAAATTSNILKYFYLWGLKSQQTDSNTEPIIIPDGKGYSLSVKIEAEGTDEQMKAFFESLNKLRNKVYCKTASIVGIPNMQNKTSEKMLKLSAEIAFYGIMDKGAGEYYMLPNGKWMPVSPAGKSDIFEPYSGYKLSALDNNETTPSMSQEQKGNSPNSTELGNYDFSIVASAFGGGFAPSVSVSCSNPDLKEKYSSPIIYGDNNDKENVEIFIEQKMGKLYCKFKTDHEAYPDGQYTGTIEFLPSGKDLRLIILSSSRVNKEDKAGVNISIVNNTKISMSYKVLNEDDASPRVKIIKTVGDVKNE